MRLQRWVAAFLVLTVLSGCDDDPVQPIGDLPMAGADAWAVENRSRARGVFFLRNRTDRTLYLRTHCAVAVDRRVDGTWESVPLNRGCALVLQRPIWLAPNEPYSEEFSFPLTGNWQNTEYRVRFEEFTAVLGDDESTFGPPLPLELRVSGPFRVQIP